VVSFQYLLLKELMKLIKGGEIPLMDRFQRFLEPHKVVTMGKQVAMGEHIDPNLSVLQDLGREGIF
jgi:hypothetical protein